MKILLGTAALVALIIAVAPAEAQRGHGGGGFHGGGFHGGGFHGGGFHGGFRGGFGGPRLGIGFGFGAPYYYPPYYYGAPYYAYPYPPAPAYGYDDDEDYGPPPPPPQDEQASAPPRSSWHVTHQGNETDFELPDSVLFALDSAKVSKDAGRVLQEIADAAQDRPGARLVVEGHTDTSGTREHNEELSKARADAVAAVLAREGVERERVTTEDLGESKLAVQTGDGVREPRNRRVIVRLIGGRQAARDNGERTSDDR